MEQSSRGSDAHERALLAITIVQNVLPVPVLLNVPIRRLGFGW
jgi:hypothetical protein